MKKVIGGKRYDTETAKEMGYDYYGTPRDFNHWTETLYRKRTGEYFLHGEGGPMSRYAQTIGQNEWSGGEQIQPLTVENARQWAEEHLSADEYESIFGEISEDDSKKTVTFSIATDAVEILSRLASETGKTKSELVEEMIRNHK
jgi:hypothetical protein